MAGFERGAHDFGVAGAVESVIRAAVGQRDDRRDFVTAHAAGVEEVGHAEAATPFLAVGIDVDAHDLARTGHARTLDHVEPIPPRPKTTTLSPTCTLAVLTTAPTPVVTPQPM
jgi:hypothetical protein